MSIKASGYMILAIDSPPHTQIVSLLFFNPFYRCGGGGERRNFPPRSGRPAGRSRGAPAPLRKKRSRAFCRGARARRTQQKALTRLLRIGGGGGDRRLFKLYHHHKPSSHPLIGSSSSFLNKSL